jgi:NADPH:quinone reductase
MKAVVMTRAGGPEVLEVRDEPDPTGSPGRLVVDVEAVGINYRDVYEREGAGEGSTPAKIVGVEGSGTIADAGDGAADFAVGDRVAWVDVAGSYAERVAVDATRAVPVPHGVSSERAASLLSTITAHYLASDSYRIEPGDAVIVHAAAGGVGALLTQIAKLRGGYVIATTSTDEKAELARRDGADEVLCYEGFARRAKELTDDEGVAAVYDGVGRTTFLEGLRALRPLGTMVIYGTASGQPDPLPVAALESAGSLYVQRPTIATYIRTTELLRKRAEAVLQLIRDGDLNVRIGARYPLDQARQAHEDLQARKTTGKLILVP